MRRRQFLQHAGAAMFPTLAGGYTAAQLSASGGTMYGLIGKINCVPGQRDAFAALLLDGTGDMPGCFSYVIAADPSDENGLWITEVWDSQASHKASLSLPSVQAAIAKGRPMIAGFSNRAETTPLGGIGLPKQ